MPVTTRSGKARVREPPTERATPKSKSPKLKSPKLKSQNHVLSAPPPWHAIALFGLMVAIFLSILPSFESLDHIATTETFTRRLFPDLVSLPMLVFLRGSCFVGMLVLQLHTIFIGQGWIQVTTYLPESRLKRNVVLSMTGIRTMTPFTSWAWNLLTASFGVSTYISWKCWNNPATDDIPRWLLRTGILLFEVSAPTALLVAFVVRYGIWPQVLLHGSGPDPTAALKQSRTLAWHNLNVVMVLSEVSLWGGLPVRYMDLSLSAWFGMSYILFTWASMHSWGQPEDGPQFLYFFFDTTLGKTTTIALLFLLVVLIVFYGLFCVIHQVLDHVGGGPVVHGLAVVVVASLVCRFRD